MTRVPDAARAAIVALAVVAAACGPEEPTDAGPAPDPASFVVEATIAGLQEALRSGRLDCSRVVAAYRERIVSYDDSTRLNAITVLNPAAPDRADSLDRVRESGAETGPLHCVPTLVKDNMDTGGMVTTGGSEALRNSVPPDDATIVRRMRQAGAVVVAKTNMAEWAFSPRQTVSSSFDTTRNAYALDRVPAGSSGGTASGIAASFGLVGLGTDTGNSIRGPSSHLALFGIRSTLGLVSLDGIIPLYYDRDVAGPMTRTVEDAARVLTAIAGRDSADPYTRLGAGRAEDYTAYLDPDGLEGARVGVLRALAEPAESDSAVLRLFDRAVADLRRHGAEVVDPFAIPELEEHLEADLTCPRFRHDVNRYLESLGPDAPIRDVATVLETGEYAPYVEGALESLTERPGDVHPSEWDPPCPDFPEHEGRQVFREDVVAAMDSAGVDVVVYPTWTHPPAHVDSARAGYEGDNSQLVAPGTGLPAATVPMGFTRGRHPAGLQILARPFEEGTIIRVAHGYERATGHRRPPEGFPPLGAPEETARSPSEDRPDAGSAVPPYDLLVRGGTVVDGTGEEPFPADVAVEGDRIVRVARAGLSPDSGARVLDASGLVVAPGFVDQHAHVQTALDDRPLAENFLRQGITTILASLHSGDQPYPLAPYADSLERKGIAPNVGFFAGHTWARKRVIGDADRAPTGEEIAEMKGLVREAMEDGALGLSTGLLYVPASYAGTDEVIALAEVASEHGGIYLSHLRDEATGLLESVRELIRIADEAEIPAQVQHHKAVGVTQWGWSEKSLALIDSARAEGLDVKHDVYPYVASSTTSRVLFPRWALSGGIDSLAARLDDPETRDSVVRGMRDIFVHERAGDDLSRIQFRTVPSMPGYDGRTMADLARDRGMPNDVASGIDLAIELQLDGGFSAIYHAMSEEDLRRILRHDWSMVCTDGDPVAYGRGHPHPRSYGAFPRVLGRYVREEGVLGLEEAVRKMTSLAAEQIGQTGRGRVREGAYADLTVFDPDRVEDRATFTDPHRYSVGIVHVMVNGVPVIEDASLTGRKPGRVLEGPARPGAVER